jgi:hypothetical protein
MTTLGRGGSRPGENYWKPKPKPAPAPAPKPKPAPAPTAAPTNTPPARTPIETEQPAWLGGEGATGPGAGGGGGGGGGSTANDYYGNLLTEQQKAAQERMQAALDANNAYIPQVNKYADKRLQDAYISKELNRVNLPQQLSALGYSGGPTETSMLGAMTGYENRRGAIEQDRSDAVGKIRQNAAQIEATGNADLADAASNYYQNMIAKAQRDEENALSQSRWQTEFSAGQQSEAYQNQLDMAKLKASYGDYSGLQALGISVNALNDGNGSTPSTRAYTARNTGGTSARTANTPAASGNYNTVLMNVKRALGGSNAGSSAAWDQAVNYIQNSLRNRIITESEAQRMLGDLGLN